MRVIGIIGFIYCVLATVGLGAYLVLTVQTINGVAGAENELAMQLPELADVAKADRHVFSELKEKQREGRAEYDGPMAVDASFAVQEAHDAYSKSQQQADACQEQIKTLQAKHSKLSVGLVPVIALLLLHALIALVVNPLRGDQRRRAASRYAWHQGSGSSCHPKSLAGYCR